jgi:hypothetical protein
MLKLGEEGQIGKPTGLRYKNLSVNALREIIDDFSENESNSYTF